MAFTSADIEGSGTLASASLRVSRQRLMVEGSHARELASGATLTPSIEFGLRHDGGDGETGAGIEAGGALRYASAASGLTLEGRVRTLLRHDGDDEEWGVSALMRVDPGTSGRGLALVVQPAWGPGGQRSAAVVGARRQCRRIAGQPGAPAGRGRLRTGRGARLGRGDAVHGARTRGRRRAVVAHGRALGAGAGREHERRRRPARNSQRPRARACPVAARWVALVTSPRRREAVPQCAVD